MLEGIRKGIMNVQFENIPKYLKERKQWVCHGTRMVDGKERDKIPLTPARDGSEVGWASSDKPKTWRTYKTAKSALEARPDLYNGIGYVPLAEEGLFIADPDDTLLANGEVLPETQRLLDCIDTYVEISPSGAGLHVIGFGELPTDAIAGLEVWDSKKYVTITGNLFNGSSSEIQDIGDSLVKFAQSEKTRSGADREFMNNHFYEQMDAWFEEGIQVPDGERQNTIGSYIGREIRLGSNSEDVLGALLRAQADGAFGDSTEADIRRVFKSHWTKYTDESYNSDLLAASLIKEEPAIEEKKTKARLGIMSWSDLDAKVWGDDFWLIPDNLQRSGINMVAGPVWGGKSWFELDNCIGLASGTPTLLGEVTQPVNVLYLGADSGMRATQMRIRQLLAGRGITDCSPKNLYVSVIPFSLLSIMGTLEQEIQEKELGYIGIDLLTAYAGGINLDRSYEIRPLINSLRTLAEKYEMAISIVVRENKSKSMTSLDSISHSVEIPGAADTVYGLTPGTGKVDAKIFKVKTLKNKVIGDGPKFSFSIYSANGGDSLELKRALASPTDMGIGKKHQRIAVKALEHLQGLGGSPTAKPQLWEAIGVPKSSKRMQVDILTLLEEYECEVDTSSRPHTVRYAGAYEEISF